MPYAPPVPVMQIRPGGLLFYDQWETHFSRLDKFADHSFSSSSSRKKYTGFMTPSAQRKLRFVINLLVAQAKPKRVLNPTTGKYYTFKINFITLTLSAPQKDVTDRQIKKQMFEPWLKNMRNVYGLRSYVWRAERQKNGNIHFHVTSDTYIPLDSLRDAWNFQQEKFHFISDFRNKHKSEYPNSTDVHAVWQIRNLSSYLVKYMSKNERAQDHIEGKVWDCSTNLKTKERVVFEMSASDFDLLSKLQTQFSERFKTTDHCSLLSLTDSQMQQYLPIERFQPYLDWLERVHRDAGPTPVKRLS